MRGNQLSVHSGTYIDDMIRVGNKESRILARKTDNNFEMKGEEELPCSLACFRIIREGNNIFMQQQEYLKSLKIFQEEA